MNQPAYIPGDFYRICDRCGSKMRASQTSRTWDGLYVCAEDFESRHPQDFVRGRKDVQSVPDARPEPVNNIIGPLTTALTAAATAASTTLTVESSVRFEPDDHIGVVADHDTIARTVNTVPTSTTITITSRLGATAAIGSVIINYSAVSEPDIG